MSIREFNTILKENELHLVPEIELVDSHSDSYNEHGDNVDIDTNGETNIVEADTVVVPELALSQPDPTVENKLHRQSSINISGQEVASNFGFIFDSPASSLVSISPLPQKVSVPVIAQYPPSTRRQKFRKWWTQKKASFIGFLTACCSCGRKDSRTDDLTDCK